MARTASTPEVPDARERIFRAAEELFARKGYDGAAIVEITNRAGVNRGLPFYYWEGKRALYAEVVQAGLSLFAAMVEETLSGEAPASERLAAFARGHLRLLTHRPDAMRVVDRCLLDGHVQELGLAAGFQTTVGRLERFFREGCASGELRPVDPELAARVILGPGFIFSMWRLYEGSRFTEEQLGQFVADHVVCAFRRIR
jgi:AcrR family transcriptional regulator